jgi:hypothetical protein|tara:strand:+ start:389 stop:595 length:207 start_codon:yes stop_codon:yes gene_type:complete
MKWHEILWGSKEEDAVLAEKDKNVDPSDLSIENAYKTRWIWYHTLLAVELLLVILIQLCILVILAVKL